MSERPTFETGKNDRQDSGVNGGLPLQILLRRSRARNPRATGLVAACSGICSFSEVTMHIARRDRRLQA